MVSCWTKRKHQVKEMLTAPSCFKVSTAVIVIVAVVAILGNLIGATSTTTEAPTTSRPSFIDSPLFVGLAAGLGGFIGFIVLLCLLWKCCCSGKDD